MKKLVYLVFATLIVGSTSGQTFYNKLCKDYKFAEYIKKNGSLTEAKSKKYNDQHDLALSYYFVQDSKKALIAFDKLQSDFNEVFTDEDRFYFALSAMRNSNTELAKSLISQAKQNNYLPALNSFYQDSIPESYWNTNGFPQILADSFSGNCNLVLSKDNSNRYLGLYSDNSDKVLKQKNSDVFNQPYYSLNIANLSIRENQMFAKNLTSIKLDKLHRVNSHYQPSQYWPNQNKFLFVENSEKENFNSERVLKVYLGYIDDNKNVKRVPLNINNDSFSLSSFVISPNEKLGIFSSNGFSSKGMSDIFLCDIVTFNEEKFEVNNVRSVSPNVNTSLRDNFPWFLNDSVIVFASEGHWGNGGLDLFQYCITSQKFARLPIPFNSNGDDFGFTSVDDFVAISSNRNRGTYMDRVYATFAEAGKNNGFLPFTSEQPIDSIIGSIVAIDPSTKLPFSSDTKTEVLNSDGVPPGSSEVAYWINEDNSIVKMSIEEVKKKSATLPNTKLIAISQPGFYNQIICVPDNTVINTKLEVEMESIKGKDELGIARGIGPVYFDLDKYELDANDKKSLDQLALFLKDNPKLKIELRSHTDSRASRQYNIQLSQKRSKSVQTYLIKNHGFTSSRFVLTWVGESQLAEKCPDGVDCDEMKHSLNRRTTFHIISANYTEKAAIANARAAQKLIEDSKGLSKITKSNSKSVNVDPELGDKIVTDISTSSGAIEVYRIQFKLSQHKLKKSEVVRESGISDVYTYQHNGYFKYTTGQFNSRSEAEEKVKEMRSGKFKDCFVVKFVGDKRVD